MLQNHNHGTKNHRKQSSFISQTCTPGWAVHLLISVLYCLDWVKVGSENLRISLQDLIPTVVVMVYGMSHVCGARAGCLQLFVCHCTTQAGCPACVRVKITVHSVLICIICACCLDLYQLFMLPLICISCAHCCVICINCACCLDLYQLCMVPYISITCAHCC